MKHTHDQDFGIDGRKKHTLASLLVQISASKNTGSENQDYNTPKIYLRLLGR